MQMRKKTIKKVLIAGGSSLLIITGCAVVLSQTPHHTDAEQVQEQVTPVAKSGVLGEAGVANNQVADSQQPQVSSNSPQHAQAAPAAPTAPSGSSSINNENEHETSSPPSDELVDVEPVQIGVLSGTLTTSRSTSYRGFPAGFETIPFQGKVSIKDTNNNPAQIVNSDANGNFSVALSAGTYTVTPLDGGDFYYTPAPTTVVITVGHTTTITFDYMPMGTTNALVF